MEGYAGFEPQVGEIRAVRSFRIGPAGGLYALFSDAAWVEGPNTARCMHLRSPDDAPAHAAPNPECTCGFYAYGSDAASAEHPHGRHVLAVVACWGRVIAGTRGLRAEHCRIEALWLSGTVPEHLVALVRERHPSIPLYRDRARMLADHPPTVLDCYELPEFGRPRSERWLWAAALGAVLVGLLPADRLGGSHMAGVLWGLIAALFLLVAAFRSSRRDGGGAAQRRRVLCLAVVLWMLAPFAGFAGVLLLRLPLLEIAALTMLQRHTLLRAATRFPADIGA
jgi:hypothetical protein